MIPGISLEEINKVTDKYKNQQNRFAYIMGPETSPGITLPGNADILAALDAKSKADIKPYEEKAIATALMKKEPVKGKVVSKTKNSVLRTTELLLGNGIRVTLKSTDYKSDQILLSAGRYGGIGAYPVEDKYSAENAGAIISTMGVGEFSPTDLRKALAGKTVSLSPVINQNIDGFRGNSSNKDIETHVSVAEPLCY